MPGGPSPSSLATFHTLAQERALVRNALGQVLFSYKMSYQMVYEVKL